MSNTGWVISAPVSTTDVGTVLQSSSHDVGTLCTHDNINRWSKYKPMSIATVTKPTETQMLYANYGMDADSIASNDLATLFTLAQANPEWPYIKPTGGSSSPYRLGDFDGYNHKATCPYTSYLSTSIETYNNTVTLTPYVEENDDAEFLASDALNTVVNGGADWQYACAYRRKGSTNAITIAYPASVYDEGIYEFVLDVSSGYTYEVLLIYTRETEETSSAQISIYIPNGYYTCTVTKVYINVGVTFTENPPFYFEYVSGSYMDTPIMHFYTPMYVTAMTSDTSATVTSSECRIDFNVEVQDSSGNVATMTITGDTSGSTGSFTYSGKSSTSYTLDYNAGETYALADYVGDDVTVTKITKITVTPELVKTGTSGNAQFYVANANYWVVTTSGTTTY